MTDVRDSITPPAAHRVKKHGLHRSKEHRRRRMRRHGRRAYVRSIYFLPSLATLFTTSTIERHPPDHPHEPAAELVAVAQIGQTPARPDEGLLRDVLRILALAEHAERHAKRQRERIGQPRLEVGVQIRGVAHQAARKPPHQLIHRKAMGSRLQ